MNSIISKAFTAITLAFGVCCCLSLNAQVQTQTSTQAGFITEISVEKGEVVSVNGNDLVVKMADGSLRHIANVAESARVTVDGQQLGIHDLKPGMKLQRTISVTTTPQTITTVQSVTGNRVACESTPISHPHDGEWREPTVQDPPKDKSSTLKDKWWTLGVLKWE